MSECQNRLCRDGYVPDPDEDYGSGNGPYFRIPCPGCSAKLTDAGSAPPGDASEKEKKEGQP